MDEPDRYPPIGPSASSLPFHRIAEFVQCLWRSMEWCARHDLTDDCLQEARVSIWQAREKLKLLPPGELEAYAATCAKRAALRFLIKEIDADRRVLSYDTAVSDCIVVPLCAPDPLSDRWLAQIEHPELAEVVCALLPIDRDILHLYYAQGMTDREIACDCGLSVSAIQQRRSRLIRRLRRILLDPSARNHRERRVTVEP